MRKAGASRALTPKCEKQREKVHNAQITDLVTKVEARLREAPEDDAALDALLDAAGRAGRKLLGRSEAAPYR